MSDAGDRPPARRGGRPRQADAALLRTTILDAAAASFIEHGYAGSSIERIAAAAGIAKRTFYARFHDKADLFRAVLQRMVAGWAVPYDARMASVSSLEEALRLTAERMLEVALRPEALALHRLAIAEASRFPELAMALQAVGAGAGVLRIAALLQREWPRRAPVEDAEFAAELFMQMVLTGPQRRALGLGTPLDDAARAAWGQRAVTLFLAGWGGSGEAVDERVDGRGGDGPGQHR